MVTDIIKVETGGKYVDTTYNTTYNTSRRYNECQNGIN
nr:MAG TPA: hypothetical protein [Caudoviricetes sp.]